MTPLRKVWKGQMVRVLNKISVGSMDRGHNEILSKRREIEQKHIKLRNKVVRDISEILDIRVGGKQSQLMEFPKK